jgi:hypothetical protein
MDMETYRVHTSSGAHHLLDRDDFQLVLASDFHQFVTCRSITFFVQDFTEHARRG